jgi:hypothetical protein
MVGAERDRMVDAEINGQVVAGLNIGLRLLEILFNPGDR